LDRLASVSVASGTTTTLKYAGPVREPVSDGQYTYARGADGSLLSARETSSGTTTNLLSDVHHNAVAGTAPKTGVVNESRGYDAFGAVTAGSGTHSNVGFQGGWTDPGTGKVAAEARWYDPSTGTFASRDSADAGYAGAASLNRYGYGNANPTSNWDPTGHWGIPGAGSLLDKATSGLSEFAGEFAGAVEVGTEAVEAGVVGTAVPAGVGICAGTGVCEVLVAAGAVVLLAGGVYALVNADGSTSYAGDYGPIGWTAPRDQPEPAPDKPKVQRPKTATTWITKTWSTTSQWYDDTYLYTRTDNYTQTNEYQWTYYSRGLTVLTGQWTTTKHTWSVVTRPLIDLDNPIQLPTPVVGPPQPGKKATPASGNNTCSATSTSTGCRDKTQELPPGAVTGAGGGKPSNAHSLTPVQAQLADACFTGALQRSNGSKSSGVWECGGGAAAGSASDFMAPGEQFALNASNTTPLQGYHDVIVHGSPDDFGASATSWSDGTNFSHRVLARLIEQDPTYQGGPIRLLSCSTGASACGAAKNLANKLGVEVMAPTDTLWAFPSGRLVIGPTYTRNTGSWVVFSPGRP
jgi:RHS repeat-associated protein